MNMPFRAIHLGSALRTIGWQGRPRPLFGGKSGRGRPRPQHNRQPCAFPIIAILSSLILTAPAIAQQNARQGAYIAEIQDEDGDKVIQMETDWMSMLLMPDIGATVTKFTFRPTQNEILDLVQPKNLKTGGGLLQDNVWEQDWRYQELRGKYYNYQITQRGPDQVQVVFEKYSAVEYLSSKEHALIHDAHFFQQTRPRKLLAILKQPRWPAIKSLKSADQSVENVAIGVLCGSQSCLPKVVRPIKVIRVLPAKQFSRGFPESPVQRRRLTFSFSNNTFHPRCILLDHLQAAIRRATVNHDMFDIRIALQQYRTNRLFNKWLLIE